MRIPQEFDLLSAFSSAFGEPVYDGFVLTSDPEQVPYIVCYDVESTEITDTGTMGLKSHDCTLYRYTMDGARNRRIDAWLVKKHIGYTYIKQYDSSSDTVEERYSLDDDSIMETIEK